MKDSITLPPPQKELDFPLMRALSERRSKRKFESERVTLQQLSDILFAACGQTKVASKTAKSRRTVPSGRNSQTMYIGIAIREGVYRYNESAHELIKIIDGDYRADCANQKMLKNAPLALIYISDFSKLKGYVGTDDQRKQFVAGTETGFISQNVYLICTALQLSTVVIGLVNREHLAKAIQLPKDHHVIYTQVVG